MGIALKFLGGIVMTLAFVVVVPYVTEQYITPFVIELVGDNTYLFLGSQALIQLILFIVLIVFILLLGGGAVLRWCGLFGVLGMIVAYYLLGDVKAAIIPLISLAVAYIIMTPWRTHKKIKEGKKELKEKIKKKGKRSETD